MALTSFLIEIKRYFTKQTLMKNALVKLDTGRAKTFYEENKLWIAALGGITVGIAVASLLGNEKARQALRTMGTTFADASGRFVNNLGGYKQLLSPLLAKSEVQGL
jgi:hypothetical protein